MDKFINLSLQKYKTKIRLNTDHGLLVQIFKYFRSYPAAAIL